MRSDSDDHVDSAREAHAGMVDRVRIGKLEIFDVRFAGRSIGTVNAHKPDRIHAIDLRSRVHYAATIEACEQWLMGRAS